MNLEEKARTALQSTFDIIAPPRVFSAPGRVNLIGEHTDYNDGFVLPAAINFKTVVAAAPRTDSIIEVFAVDMDDIDTFDLTASIIPSSGHMWANYLRGMAKVLVKMGYPLTGASLAITGNIPTGAGLSSSASLEMALGYAFLALSGTPIDGARLAKAGQDAENNFVGVQCGIMDQFISALGKKDHAMLLDCRDLHYESVSIPSDTAIIIVDSGIKRGLVDSEYNTRREQCTSAAKFLGVQSLRDVSVEMFDAHAGDTPPVLAKRARHVITENDRTRRTAAALEMGDMHTVGTLLNASHVSMRDDFEITVPAIDTLVEILQNIPGVYGARMTGGGFGGCCVALTPNSVTQKVIDAVETQYPQKTCCYNATVYRCHASDGAGERVFETIS